ncbi:hypothetical protein [Halalkalicoccus jeotgali]|uniref:Uncharacterized protein n=1 Tax=Halalkalicoccus jeotgali (strain DSM 18796 / CECT 7217 / JCM 14584 / KCTC 4019 / B3) TaxID=795797 RepID=D8J8W1_HALJB|nr:hypothetical protein [Halalkalicoccus jeotgali]ADJ14296.1 hypothetical protein HacjB3_04525 [Halalkalicoccus jeotgali B3]ELY40558.1 hypothetical protein C497_02887 [Halalkalicoccus jeotgali B3]
MRVKPVPEAPDSVEAVAAIRAAVPLVPEPEASCCDRLVARTDVDPDTASDWLTFLRGLGLVREGSSGFHRTREEPELGEALLAGVYGAREVEGILSEHPRTADEVFERFEAVPRWERHRTPDWETLWSQRIGRLLEWFVLLGLAERRTEGYVSLDRSGSRP